MERCQCTTGEHDETNVCVNSLVSADAQDAGICTPCIFYCLP